MSAYEYPASKGGILPVLASTPELAVIVPTYNEGENVAELAARLEAALAGVVYEVIFVDDDSPDGTADRVREMAREDARVRCLQRIHRRGLSTAVIEGILATSAPFAAVIDGDLQHDETRLAAMLETLKGEGADLVVGTRYADGGGTGNWDSTRRQMSAFATRLAQRLIGAELSDPMSGFFMVRTEAFRARTHGLSGAGFKILLDLLATPGPKMTVREVPYEFRSRLHGESKLDHAVLLQFLELLIAKTVGRYVPTKFIMFSLVGAGGVLVHMALLTLLYKWGGAAFATAQAMATLVAMVTNFFVNNIFTYHDRRLRGWKILPGLLSFCIASSVGALANVGVAIYLFETSHTVWFLSALAGIVVGAAWNYAVTALYTWKS